MLDFFTAEPVTHAVTAIRSRSGEIMYLVQGREHAILIDTSIGVKGLRAFVSGLTSLPLTLLLTHGHIDHAMGAPEFEDVYMSKKDHEIYLGMRAIEDRRGYAMASISSPVELPDDAFVPPVDFAYRDLTDGMVFDLGGVHVNVYALPGHTPGSMVMLIPEERILILGDACNPFTFLFDKNSLPVETYKEELVKLKTRLAGMYDRVFLCHRVIEVPAQVVDDNIELCDDIMAGRTDDVPFEFLGKKAYIAKALNQDMSRLDGKTGNIVYNKNAIFQKHGDRA